MIQFKKKILDPIREFETILDPGEKITVVHERRVGYTKDDIEWKLSQINLEIINLETQKVIDIDNSLIDTVHQVSNCLHILDEKTCSANTKTIHALIKVKRLNKTIDGSVAEPFIIAASKKLFLR